MSRKLLLLTTMLAPCVALAALEAREAAAAEREVIVVTAQRRAQDVQDVPIAVSAFTANQLDDRQVQDVSMLNNLAPNVVLDAAPPFSGSTSVLSAAIRGIGQNDFAFNFDPGVGVYLDGVYLARTVGANTDLLDIERIEVLKGPQGTLFGRNAVGGAISIVTRDPGTEYGGQADFTVGSYDRFDARGTVDLPLTETLRAAVAFSSKYRDGYQERIPFPQDLVAAGIPDCAAAPAECTFIVDDIHAFPAVDFATSDTEGGQDEWNLRTKLLWEITPDLTARITADYTNVDQSAAPNTLLDTTNATVPSLATLPALPPATNFGSIYNTCISTLDPSTSTLVFLPLIRAPDTLFPGDPGDTGERSFGDICGFRGTVPGTVPIDDRYLSLFIPAPLAGANVDGDPTNNRLPWDDRFVLADPDKSYATGLSFSRLTQWGVGTTLDWNLGPNMALKSITAYRRQSWASGMDLDGSPLHALHISFNMHQHQWSQEFQLNGAFADDRVNYVLGAYWFEEEGDLLDLVTFHNGLLQVDGPNDLNTEAWAVFGNVNVALTEQLGLTLGVRYTEEEKAFEGFQSDLNGFNYKITNCYPPDFVPPGAPAPCQVLAGFPDPTDPLRFFPPGVDERSFDDLSPRVGLEYHVTDDHMLYASWSKGFKSGSWTTRLSAPLPPGDPKRVFGPEEAESYEIGLKSQYFDGMLTLNSAAFFTEYTDIQLNQFEAISPTLRNAGDAEIYGGEVELAALFGNGFSLNGSLGYLHSEYTRIAPGVSAGAELPKTPEWSLNVGPQYQFDLSGGGALVLGADYTYRSEVFNDTENNAANSRPDTSIFNVAATYRSAGDDWELAVGGTNVTDERYLVNGVIQPASGWEYGVYNRPAEWWARLRTRF